MHYIRTQYLASTNVYLYVGTTGLDSSFFSLIPIPFSQLGKYMQAILFFLCLSPLLTLYCPPLHPIGLDRVPISIAISYTIHQLQIRLSTFIISVIREQVEKGRGREVRSYIRSAPHSHSSKNTYPDIQSCTWLKKVVDGIHFE